MIITKTTKQQQKLPDHGKATAAIYIRINKKMHLLQVQSNTRDGEVVVADNKAKQSLDLIVNIDNTTVM